MIRFYKILTDHKFGALHTLNIHSPKVIITMYTVLYVELCLFRPSFPPFLPLYCKCILFFGLYQKQTIKLTLFWAISETNN